MVHKLKMKGQHQAEYRGFEVARIPQGRFRDYQAQRYWYDVPALGVVAYSMPDLKKKVDAKIEQGVA